MQTRPALAGDAMRALIDRHPDIDFATELIIWESSGTPSPNPTPVTATRRSNA